MCSHMENVRKEERRVINEEVLTPHVHVNLQFSIEQQIVFNKSEKRTPKQQAKKGAEQQKDENE